MRILSITIISILFLGCNTSKKISDAEREAKTIVGTWEFVSEEVFNPHFKPDSPVFQPKNDSTYNMLQFFGAEIISELPGKRIQFIQNNQVKLDDIIEGNGLEKLNLKYKFDHQDSLLTFTLVIPKDSSKMYVPTKTILGDSSMIWNIDDFMQIKLKRIK